MDAFGMALSITEFLIKRKILIQLNISSFFSENLKEMGQSRINMSFWVQKEETW
jgi:hypothetical protein